ncbi:MAG: nitroreductase family protein [Muribaculaceae bacterium]|nr:nitroreductase family protein [Muribaculaceae bacterium]
MEIDFESLRNLMKSNRTVRRFNEKKEVSEDILFSLVELTRYCPSGRNAQPLRYAIVNSKEEKQKIFPLLKWAGYFKEWDGPEEGERPAAYIIQYLDTKYGKECLCDDGLQLEAITLGMHTLGLAGCIIKAFNGAELSKILNFGDRYVSRYVLAIGYPREHVQLEDMSGKDDTDFKYYRSADGIHHVPKRPLSELILN